LTDIGKRYDLFKEVRGIGLLLGCVLTERWKRQAQHVMNRCLEQGVMVLQAGPDVIRLVPSLVIAKEKMDSGLERLAEAAKRLSDQ
jgi:acetylornithine/N-succinyldiaminopimelate aminotransferase